MAKEINFEGARLLNGGGLIRNGVIVRAFFTIILADGTQYQRVPYASQDDPGLMGWERWHESSKEDGRRSHYRKASKPARMQLQKWLYAHPDYRPDGSPQDE